METRSKSLLVISLLAGLGVALSPRIGEPSKKSPSLPPKQVLQTTSPLVSIPAATTSVSSSASQILAEKQIPQPTGAPSSLRLLGAKSVDVPADFIDQLVTGGDKLAKFTLADGRLAEGKIEAMKRDAKGVLWVRGKLHQPEMGSFYFQRQTVTGKAGPMVGRAILSQTGRAFRLVPNSKGSGAMMVETLANYVQCAGPSAGPETHPTNIPVPTSYQAVTPLQSLPGAVGVVYLDFDGEAGPFPLWGEFDAAPSGATNPQVFDVWKLVAEDFLPFNLNVTTDRLVFDSAPEGSRIHVIITPTTTGYPGPGSGYAEVGSFNWSGDTVTWVSFTSGKNCAEIASHEIGHTLGLWTHHGRTSPVSEYYAGHGSGATGWAPIMGSSLSRSVSQWCKGEYLNANHADMDDLVVIGTANNSVTTRVDDGGETLPTARPLNILTGNVVSNEGIIETAADVDAFRFVTTGGAVSVNVNPASLYPNLDILAELVDASTGTVITSSNPDLTLNATLSTTLAAGEYLVRVSGVGRADPLTTGYSDYASLGTYFISGTIAGTDVTPSFSIAENAANGTSVGTVVPKNSHGGSINFTITSGNTGGAFAINASTGAITVANSTALDFEALSSQWDDPATFELQVSITGGSPANDELIRTLVTLTNVNEAPTVASTAVTIMEHTRPGARLVRVNGDDLDPFDFPTFSIVAGNTGSVFAIEGGSGYITMASDLEVTVNTVYTLTIQVADTGTPALTASATVTITVIATPDDYEPGRIVRTFFDNITGTSVANLTGNAAFPNAPTSELFLPSLDAALYNKRDFGDTLRAHLMPPATGTYTFWIASSDASELRLGTDATEASASVIASVTSSTAPHAWDAAPSQQSVAITLTAGQPYWLEVRHKKGATGEENVSVAWQGAGVPTRQVISGLYLSPVYQNYAPTVAPATLTIRENAVAGQTLGTITTSDVNRQDTFSGYSITAGNPGGLFGIDSSTGRLFLATPGVLNATTTPSYTLTVSASDNGTPALSDTASITVNVLASTGVNGVGMIQQRWNGTFFSVADLLALPAYPFQPSATFAYSAFSTPSATANLYGSRVRVLLKPTVSGSYFFYASADDQIDLWFATNATGAGATKIITLSSATPYDNFLSLGSQKSAAVTLTAGQTYYLEAQHTQGGNSGFVQVAWTGPGISTPTIIGSPLIEPFDLNTAPTFTSGSYAWNVPAATPLGTVIGTVAATDSEVDPLTYAITSGNGAGTFTINAETGSISVAVSANLTAGAVFNLQVTAQDRGIGWVYPLRSAVVPVTITVPLPNLPPTGPSSLSKAAASRGLPYSATLAGDFTDPNPGDVLTFTKQSGPAWLIVATSGALSGTPGVGDVGANAWTIRITDSGGLFMETVLSITVQSVNNAPVWTNHSLTKPTGTIGSSYSSSVAADASDPDPGDTLTFSKVTGPAWLSVAANGALSGTPAITDVGVNSWSIRVTDVGGLFDTATLQITVTAPALGSPWTSADIGSTGRTGATVSGGGVYNQAGAGVGVSGTADAFQFASQSLTADGEIRVRLTALGGPANANGGVMIREGTSAGAKVAFFSVRNGNFIFSSRTSTGGSANVVTVTAANAAPNNWLRLTRSAGVLTAYRSADGTTWTNSGTVTLSSVTTLLVGIATASGDTSNLATSTFDNVQITPFPSQWTVGQVGSVTATGRAEFFNNTYTLSGAGTNGGSADAFLFCQQTIAGDGQIIARVSSIQNTGTSARTGIEMRDGTATGAKRAFFGISPDGTYRFQYRTKNNGADTVVTGGTGTPPNVWLKLVRAGSTISAYKSADGTNWTLVTSKTVSLVTNALCGLCVGSGSTTTLNTSVFDNVSFTP